MEPIQLLGFSPARRPAGIAPQRGVVYISEAYYSERRARVDGVPAELHRSNLAFSAVEVEPGRHRITIRYVPQSWYVGLAVTFLTLVSWTGFGVREGRRNRRASKGDSAAERRPILERLGSFLGVDEEASHPSPPLPKVEPKRMVKGVLLALLCGVVALAAAVAFLAVTAPVGRAIHVRWVEGIDEEQRGRSEH